MIQIEATLVAVLLAAAALSIERSRLVGWDRRLLREGVIVGGAGLAGLVELLEYLTSWRGTYDPAIVVWSLVSGYALLSGSLRTVRALIAVVVPVLVLTVLVGYPWPWAVTALVMVSLAAGILLEGGGSQIRRASLVALLGLGAIPGSVMDLLAQLSPEDTATHGLYLGLGGVRLIAGSLLLCGILARFRAEHERLRTHDWLEERSAPAPWRTRWLVACSVPLSLGAMLLVSSKANEVHADMLRRSVALVAAALDPDDVAALLPSDLDEPPGSRLRTLRALRSAKEQIPGAFDVYIAGMRQGELRYLAGAQVDPEFAVVPGEPVDSTDLPLWMAILAGAPPEFSPPSSDRWGSWVSAFAGVDRSDRKAVIAVVGVDYETHEWARRVQRAASAGYAAFLALVALALSLYFGISRSRAARFGLEEARTRMELAIEGAGVMTWDARLPQALIRFTGSVPEWLAGVGRQISYASFLRRVHPEDRPRMRASRRASVGLLCDLRVKGEDGVYKWLMLRGREVARDAGQGFVGFAGTALDIDESRRQGDLSRRLALVAQHTDNSVIITDAEGLIDWVNTGFTRYTGYTLEEVRGRLINEYLGGGNSATSTAGGLSAALQNGEGFKSIFRHTHRDGTPFDLQIEARPLFEGTGGRQSGFMAVARNVTREVALERALKTQQGRLETVNRCLAGLGDDFGANIHQLTGLLGEIFQADCALYSRLEGENLSVIGGYRVPEDLPREDRAEGHVCLEVVRSQSGRLHVSGLQHTRFAQSDPNVNRYGLDTYIGRSVVGGNGPLGSLCVLFTTTFAPDEGLEVCLDLIAQAVGREEVLEASRQRLKRSLEEVELEKSRQDTLLRQLDGAVVFEDLERRIVLANDAARAMLCTGLLPGALCDEVTGIYAASFVDAEHFLERLEQLKEDGLPSTEELEAKDGRILRRSYSQVLTDSGVCEGHLWHYRDVTAERRASRIFEAIAEVGTLLVASSLRSSDWAVILEALGRAVGADRAYVFRYFRGTGDSEPQISQMAEWNNGAAEPQIDNPALQRMPLLSSGFERWDRILNEGNAVVGSVAEFPESERAELGRQSILSLVIVPITANGVLWGFIGFDACTAERAWNQAETGLLHSVATTIGLRIAEIDREAALRQARDDAEAANRAKSTFLATMSHEIRTPLNAVIGVASLFEEMELREQQQDYVRTILSSSQALLDLINNILDYSKIESGKVELEFAPMSLSIVCAQVCDILRTSAHRKGIELISRLQPGMPDAFAGDASRMRQILLNIVGNAVKFTEKGSVLLDLAVDASGTNREPGTATVVIKVIDSGVGISETVRARLFQPFVQGDSSTTRRYGGTGLGLVITSRLVDLMGGTINLDSTEGQGTTVTLRVPMRLSAQAVAGPARKLTPGLRVLVVDDLAVNRAVLREWFQAWGARCTLAETADEALRLVGQMDFDVVLSDYHMPGKDGAELAAGVRRLLGVRAPALLLMSSDSTVPTEVRVLFDGLTLKPLWPSPLRDLVAGIQRNSQRPVTTSSTPPFPGLALRVLVAEDNPNNQQVVRFMLERRGVTPVIVSNGREAVEAVVREKFDLVLMDMQMPVMDGLEASTEICSRLPDPATRPFLVAFTANAFQDERDAAKRAGMEHYLTKPVTSSQLGEILELAKKRRSSLR